MPVAVELRQLSAEVHAFSGRVVEECADVMRKELLLQARIDTGGNMRLSNVTWQNFNLDVNISLQGSKSGTTAVLGPAPGVGGYSIWSFLENGTEPHEIGVRATGRGKKRKIIRKRLLIDGNWVTGPVNHPGMPAKRTWTTGVEFGLPKALRHADQVGFKKGAMSG